MGEKPPPWAPWITIMPISSGLIPCRAAKVSAIGAMIATAAGERAPIAVSSAVTANMIHGMAATWPPTSRTAPRTSRSTVPLFCAIANRYVTPIRVTTSSAGNPARMSSVVSPTDSVPTRNAATKASAPMLMGRNVAIAKIATSARMVTISGDTRSSYGFGGAERPGSLSQRHRPERAPTPQGTRSGQVEPAARGGHHRGHPLVVRLHGQLVDQLVVEDEGHQPRVGPHVPQRPVVVATTAAQPHPGP